MKEVKAKRYAGPFKKNPFVDFIQSPIGLVPKDGGKDTRLIFHLSYPRNGHSVNAGIDEKDCTVKYPDFDDAIRIIKELSSVSKPIFIGRSDMRSAFRQVPLKVEDFCIVLMKATCPKDGQVYWFVDKCLPFGSSISCKIFQDFSSSISHIVAWKAGGDVNVNYLDDFLFIEYIRSVCNDQVKLFIEICEQICFPIALEKMFWARLYWSS